MADFAVAAAHYVATKSLITQGIPMLTIFISNLATAIISVGLSWYISHRGMAGVKIDLNNAKNEIEKLINATPAPVV